MEGPPISVAVFDTFFDQFLRERTYLTNITPKTREWYQTAWKAFQRYHRKAPQIADYVDKR